MKTEKKILSYFVILFTSALAALAYVLFVFPNHFAPAGLNGLSTMIQYLTGLKVSYLNLLFNLPLAALVFWKGNRPQAVRSMVYVVSFSLFLMLFDLVPLGRFAYETENGTSTILGPVVAGIINGFCYSLVLRCGSYTGGTDFIAILIQRRAPEANFFWLTFALNSAVALGSYFVYDFQIEPVILCILYCFLSSNVSDQIMKSGKAAIKFEIVTQDPEALSREIITRLGHSVTLVPARGMYTGAERDILLCVINKRQIPEFEAIIRRHPGTFAYLSLVKEVMGNFKHVKKNGQLEASLLDDGADGA